jgi:S-adenosyl-L-methionine hydrolase (adenosine-forming)
MSTEPEFNPSGVITLTTDFGQQGPFVATMKGAILMSFVDAKIIDVTHEVPVYWPAEAGFWLARAFRYFPRGSLHVAVVDPGVGTERDIVAVVTEGHLFIAPDNGLLAPIVARASDARIFRLDAKGMAAAGVSAPSATFHGRDIFAPVAAALAQARLRPTALGPAISEIVPAWVDDPVDSGTSVAGVVMTVDHFGNLITNIDAPLIRRFGHAVVHAGGQKFPLRRTYGDVRPGEFLALVNSFGVVEIARAEQSAAEALGLGRGAPVLVAEK